MKILKINKQQVVDIRGENLFFENVDMLIDFLWMARYKCKTNIFIMDKSMLADYFFVGDLELAIELRNKCRHYGSKLMVVGEFDNSNKSLDEFIYSCNNGKYLFLVDSFEQGAEIMSDVIE